MQIRSRANGARERERQKKDSCVEPQSVPSKGVGLFLACSFSVTPPPLLLFCLLPVAPSPSDSPPPPPPPPPPLYLNSRLIVSVVLPSGEEGGVRGTRRRVLNMEVSINHVNFLYVQFFYSIYFYFYCYSSLMNIKWKFIMEKIVLKI
ncbi:unnamed protein product [Arctogadus glacialis]